MTSPFTKEEFGVIIFELKSNSKNSEKSINMKILIITKELQSNTCPYAFESCYTTWNGDTSSRVMKTKNWKLQKIKFKICSKKI